MASNKKQKNTERKTIKSLMMIASRSLINEKKVASINSLISEDVASFYKSQSWMETFFANNAIVLSGNKLGFLAVYFNLLIP